MSDVTIAALFASPDHYLHAFDGDDAVFVRMDRAAYRRSIFLDARIDPAQPGALRVPAAALLAGSGPTPETGWIFHIAHCGSTLLARALGELTRSLVLREPLALRQLAVAPDSRRLGLVLRMLGKRYPEGGPTLVKANVPVNFVLPDIVAAQPAARAVMLHLGLRDYLLAILRSDNHRRWLRGVTDELRGPLGDLSGGDDAQRAAALWLAQTERFAATVQTMPAARVLDAERFFAEPEAALVAAARCLGVEADATAAAALVGGPLFATYSKNPAVAFDNRERLARRAKLAVLLEPELERAEAWLEARSAQVHRAQQRLREAALMA